MNLNVNPNWSYEETINNLRALRNSYEEILRSFSCFQSRKQVWFVYNTKRMFYSLNFEQWKKDRIWEYMNRDIDFDILKRFR